MKKKDGLTVVVNPKQCIKKCNNCKDICPEKAISFITVRQISVEGIRVAIEGMDEAFSKYPDDIDLVFKDIKDRNYIPDAAKDRFRQAIEIEFERFKAKKKVSE